MADLLSYALCSLADVKEILGIDSGDTTQDNLIKRKINQSTEIIEGYTHRRFKETTYTDEVYDASGRDQLVLKQFPINTSSTFTLQARDSATNDNNFSTVDSGEYFIDYNSGIIDALSTFYGGFGRWRVTYTAGYPAVGTWPDGLPWDLREACASLAAYFVNNDPATSANVSMKREGSREIQYTNNSATSEELFDQLGIKPTLDRYARVIVAGSA